MHQSKQHTTAPWDHMPTLPPKTCSAVVIGAGIAGAATAWSLAKQGWQVTVLERCEHIATEGSGNAQGVLYAQLSPHRTAQTQLLLAGYPYTLSLLHEHLIQNQHWQDCGVLHLSFSEKERKRHHALSTQSYPDTFFYAVTQAQASQLAGLPVTNDGLFFPEGGWVHPASVVRALLSHPNITCRTNCHITQLQQTESGWQLLSEKQFIISSHVVVLATAYDTKQLTQTNHYPFGAMRGQTSVLPMNSTSQRLKTVISGEGYISPAWQSAHCFGATSVRDHQHVALHADEHQQNLEQLNHLSERLYQAFAHASTKEFAGHAAVRCFSPDRLPLVGPVADVNLFNQQYKKLRVDRHHTFDQACPWLPGLYLNVAHGARGLLTAPICGELIAHYLTGSPSPFDEVLMQALNPTRFMVRQLVKGTSS